MEFDDEDKTATRTTTTKPFTLTHTAHDAPLLFFNFRSLYFVLLKLILAAVAAAVIVVVLLELTEATAVFINADAASNFQDKISRLEAWHIGAIADRKGGLDVILFPHCHRSCYRQPLALGEGEVGGGSRDTATAIMGCLRVTPAQQQLKCTRTVSTKSIKAPKTKRQIAKFCCCRCTCDELVLFSSVTGTLTLN